MRTKAFPVLSLLMLALLIPASYSSNSTQTRPTNSSSTLSNDTTASTEAPPSVSPSSNATQAKEEVSTASTRPSVSSPQTTKASEHTSPANKPDSSGNLKVGLTVFILLIILVFVGVVGCLYYMKRQQPGQENAVTRFLLGVRDSLRTRIGNLEDRMGVRLWPGGKTGEEEDVEEADEGQTEEAGQQRDGDGEGGRSETSNENKEKDKEEDSETSDDCSSVEGEDLRESVLNRQEEEEKNQNEAEDDDDTSSGSDEGESAAEGDSGGDKKADSEEIALMNCPQEDDENIDLCDVTVL
ncbi:nucleolar MIF4G domain-containing protein 1-like [Acanthochromis polyacanthus]|uniref:nucleolar MIF4G domain-containing protein 1-like n=1 Tax=Acanthochromis polyacanthus TaxID=80966 RepID=UPI000B8F2607|nr:nucleolar MIF4G domain-containing protein 1-like [Acanthochromis polyacanthus]